MKKILSICLIFVLVGLLVGTAFANDDKEQTITLVNKSGSTFSKIYLAPTGKRYWHLKQDRLKIEGGSLKDGESLEFTLPQQSSAGHLPKNSRRYWDFAVELPNGKRTNWLHIDFANVYKLEITKQKNGKLFLTYFN
ncbi:MAG: hypothetical protein IJS40_07340 [Synergistaceae bacterium]|nr:hypothetical protein [Synergistaceae bacterium]